MQDADPTQGAFLTLSGICKRYRGVGALDDVDFASRGARSTRSWARTVPASRR